MESYKAGEGARPPLSGLKSQVNCSQGMGLLVPKLLHSYEDSNSKRIASRRSITRIPIPISSSIP